MIKKNSENFFSRLWSFATRNWFITIFLACILFVALVSFYKLFLKQEQFVYAKVKVSQGLWWANTQRAPVWLAKALKPGEVEKSLTGDPTAEILSVRYYPWWSSNQYDVYITLKLKVTGNKKTGTYNFKRFTLAVGSPIELSFSSTEVNGTVMEMKPKPIKDKHVDKTITLIKDTNNTWEYEPINIGDSYFDGQEITLLILDKKIEDNPNFVEAPYANVLKKFITVKAKIKVKKDQKTNVYIYGEEQELKLGQTFNASTSNFYFQDFRLTQIK